MIKWEYRRLYIYDKKGKWIFEMEGQEYPESARDRVMNQWGEEGWELAGILPFQGYERGGLPSYTLGYVLFFKRPMN